MSRDFDDIAKNIIKQTKDIHNVETNISKDINDLQKNIKRLENKINSMDEVLTKVFDILNNIVVFLEDADDDSDPELDDEEDWTPYDERNFSSEDYDDDNFNYYEDN
jgi:peptidoglycan hydrolase CwlO-like protein